MSSIRIAVIDDHPLLREGVVETLSRHTDFTVVATGGSAAEAVKAASESRPDVILLDISMPGGGVEAARQISAAHPEIKILMLTVSEREDDVIAAMEAGARGYLLKGVTGPDLVTTVRAVHEGETYITPQIAARVLARMQKRATTPLRTPEGSGDPGLTLREEQILTLVAQGLTNKEIALKYTLSEKTVKHYMTSVLQKLQVRNRVEAVLARQRLGRPLQ